MATRYDIRATLRHTLVFDTSCMVGTAVQQVAQGATGTIFDYDA